MKSKQFQLTEAWLKKAEDDESVIENELKSHRPIFNAVCFHAQQMAEKFLKGYLVYKEKEFPKVHQVDRLVKLCGDTDKEFSRIKDAAEYLTAFYITTRYPGDFPNFTRKDAEAAVKAAQKIKDFILRKMKK